MHGTLDTLTRVEWRPLADLKGLVDQWRDLCARAVEPNVFYSPDFALAAAPVFGRDVVVALVWSMRPDPRLLGFFPVRRKRGCWTAWTHDYAPLGTPLVDAGFCVPVVRAFLDAIAPAPLLVPCLPLDGPIAQALAQRAVTHDFDTHQRATMQPGRERKDYVAAALGPKNRKELPRKRRRLAETGTLATSQADSIEPFLMLEASGWKARAGTAAAQHPKIAAFMRHATEGLMRRGEAQVDVLHLDSRPLAAAITLRMADTLYSWKIAYDEAFSRYSPGVQLVIDLTEAALANPNVARIDSCAAARHPMIDHNWRERLTLADRLVETGVSWCNPLARTEQVVCRTARATAKALRDRMRAKG